MATLVDQYYEKERAFLDALYDKWPVGQEIKGVNQETIAPEFSRSAVGRALRQFEALGILSKRMTFGDPDTGITFGRQFHYTLLVPKSVAVEVVEASIRERQAQATQNRDEGNRKGADARRGRPMRKPEPKMVTTEDIVPVALAATETEEVRAIAGDDADTTLRTAFRAASRGRYPDESAALVEAARQYAGRSTALSSKVAELEAVAKSLGMTIDTTALMATVSFEPDPGLELVAHTLPYINSLEQRIERLGETVVEMRGKVQEIEQLRNENRRLRQQNERLLAGRVQADQAAVAHA